MNLLLPLALLTAASTAFADVSVRLSRPKQDEAWADRAAALVVEWAPRIESALGVTPSSNRVVTLEFRDMPGVAHTVGSTITISTRWIRAHPEDYGMVVHELVHVVQAYPGGQPGWMVESIADQVRYFQYEPAVGAAYKPGRGHSYRSGYLPGAAFLNWLDQRTEGNLIGELNTLARTGRMTEAWLVEKGGAPLDDLWAKFAAERNERKGGNAPE